MAPSAPHKQRRLDVSWTRPGGSALGKCSGYYVFELGHPVQPEGYDRDRKAGEALVTKDTLENAMAEAERALQVAIDSHGAEHPVVAECLEDLARLLRVSKTRLLDAANLEARAKVIKAKLQ